MHHAPDQRRAASASVSLATMICALALVRLPKGMIFACSRTIRSLSLSLALVLVDVSLCCDGRFIFLCSRVSTNRIGRDAILSVPRVARK